MSVALGAAGGAAHAAAPIKFTVVAGMSDIDNSGSSGDGGPATQARINHPGDVLPLADGGFLIADTNSHRIRKVDANGTITTVVGTGNPGFSGDGGPATAAELRHPEALAPLPDGGFAFSDANNHRIRRVWPDGHISTMAGNGSTVSTGSGDTASTVGLEYVYGLDALADGTLIIAEAGPETIVLVHPNGTVTESSVAGRYVAVDGSGGYFAASPLQRQVKHVAADGTVSVVAGNGGGGTEAELNGEDAQAVGIGQAHGISAAADGGVVFWGWDQDTTYGGQLLRVTADGHIRTVWRKRTVVNGMSATPAGLLISDRIFSTVLRLEKTFLEAGPPAAPASNGVTNADPSLTFSSPEPSATFECKLDDGDWESCDAPTKQYTGIPDGDHAFRVRATDAAGVTDPSPEIHTWRSDASGPEPFALAAPADGSATSTRPTLSWAPTTDAWSSVTNYEVRLDGGKVADVAPADCGDTCSWTAPTLSDGTHSWQVVASDTPGNDRASATRTFSVAAQPTASFTVSPDLALTGQPVEFDASASSVENGSIARYEWDLDGDGTFETDGGSSPKVTRSYDTIGHRRPALRVSTGAGVSDRTDGPLEIRLAPPPGTVGASIDDGAQFTNDPEVEIVIRWPAFALQATISNDGGFANAGVFPVAATIPWTLQSSGSERLPKTVYVRFDDSVQTFSDDIILDQTAPLVRRAQALSKRRLALRASDNVSGVEQMQVTHSRSKPPAWRAYRARVKVGSTRRLWVRVRDAAGNKSRWKRAAAPARR